MLVYKQHHTCVKSIFFSSIPVAIGVEYRCYPFQPQLVLPFLPKSRTERVISSGLNDQGTQRRTPEAPQQAHTTAALIKFK